MAYCPRHDKEFYILDGCPDCAAEEDSTLSVSVLLSLLSSYPSFAVLLC
jgi:hypothetical protein